MRASLPLSACVSAGFALLHLNLLPPPLGYGLKRIELNCDLDRFCYECLHSYFSLSIAEGLVSQVHCPDPACVSARSKTPQSSALTMADPSIQSFRPGDLDTSELVSIVGPGLYSRYLWLQEKQRLESDPSLTYCPRGGCQAPVQKESEEAYDKLRICPKCTFAFCVFCRKACECSPRWFFFSFAMLRF
jgi:IBR domain, a half RING-finger domain